MDDLQISTPLAYTQPITRSTDKPFVSEAVYWQKYYEHPDIVYEWNDGILEEKPVADKIFLIVTDFGGEHIGSPLQIPNSVGVDLCVNPY